MTQAESNEAHWQRVYQNKAPNDVSWYQASSQLSLQLINQYCSHTQSLIDIGSGTSCLLSSLLDLGFTDITALDISDAALNISRQQLESRSDQVCWLHADICQMAFERTYDIWHDRAVFHFMTTSEQQQQYKNTLLAGTEMNSVIIMATFAPIGPEQCSNLNVRRHDSDSIQTLFCDHFKLMDCIQETHKTPWHSEQAFNYFVLQRNKS